MSFDSREAVGAFELLLPSVDSAIGKLAGYDSEMSM